MKHNKFIAVILILVLAVSSFNFAFAESKALAFPKAEGGGMFALGARASSNIDV